MREFSVINLPSYLDRELNKKCIDLLKFGNESELKQKHEGFSFVKTFSLEFLGKIALKKHLGLEFKNDVLNAEIHFDRSIVHNNRKYDLVFFDFDKIPKINPDCINDSIFIMRNNNQKFYICGKSDKNTIKDNLSIDALNFSIYNERYSGFIGFNQLEKVNES